MKTIIPKGCDNAPRKQIVIDFTIAILRQRIEIIKEYADESVIWHQLKEGKKVEGQSALLDLLQHENKDPIDCLEIDQVITHGKFASINGVILLTNGTKIDFCDVYTFSNTAKSGKVKEIKSYRLKP
ncbi:hypothetical protein CDO73_01445 [Saccharibacillus sp. O23]|uniref:hypothetical protein n=1 Tax=Saccharibacillus sp. O23 TaxID=2009338 RepID=UPI000B4DF74B|nr:hypothetical protein [Saccharibacillus sp. O23]OWR32301.1 hypothetical protein CDO73_01445 [Saccharibacillus sp. O23]